MIERRLANPRLLRLCRSNWRLGTFFGSPLNNGNHDLLPDVSDRSGSKFIPIRLTENQGRIDESSRFCSN